MHFALIEIIEQLLASVSQNILEIHMLLADLNVWSIQIVLQTGHVRTTSVLTLVLGHVALMLFAEWSAMFLSACALWDMLGIPSQNVGSNHYVSIIYFFTHGFTVVAWIVHIIWLVTLMQKATR